jgi:hypothetical protein
MSYRHYIYVSEKGWNFDTPERGQQHSLLIFWPLAKLTCLFSITEMGLRSCISAIGVSVLVAMWVLGEAPPPERRWGYDPRPDFLAFNSNYRAQKRVADAEYDRLKELLVEQQKNGRKAHCARQLLQEAKWYTHCTAHFDRAQLKLSELRKVLDARNDPHKREQVEADGSYACCTEQWFLKLDYTIDELISLGLTWQSPPHPVKLLERINSPEKLTAYLDSVLISDVRRTGIDTRTELNHSSSALTRFILWQGTWSEIPTNFELDPRLKDTLLNYMDKKWQDPITGYWGTWYRAVDGSVVKTSDLSITFHLVHHRNGDVKRWPEIIRTTLVIRDQEYPYGWLEDGKMTNHHNYDVVTLLRLGWKYADEQQKAQARQEIRKMLEWCIADSIETDGTFKLNDESTLGGAFYFGTAFLDQIGYFDKSKCFWSEDDFPAADALRTKIRNRITAMKLQDPEAMWALMMLTKYE